MVGRAPYLNGPYNVPRTSGPAADWRLMPAVAYLLFASHPLSNRSSGRTDLPSAGWPSAGGPSGSWIGGPPSSRPQRPPRRSAAAAALHRSVCVNQLVGGHPVGRTRHTRTGRIILAKICRLASLALPPAGRVVEPVVCRSLYGGRTAPAVWACGAQQQTADCRACRLADRPQTPGRLAASAVQGCSRCQLTPTSQWTACSVSPHLMRTLFISDCISASRPSKSANPGCNLAAAVDSEPCGAVACL